MLSETGRRGHAHPHHAVLPFISPSVSSSASTFSPYFASYKALTSKRLCSSCEIDDGTPRVTVHMTPSFSTLHLSSCRSLESTSSPNFDLYKALTSKRLCSSCEIEDGTPRVTVHMTPSFSTLHLSSCRSLESTSSPNFD